MEGQDKFIMRKSENADEEDLADVGCNADLYIVNQESTDLTREVHTGDAPFGALFNGGSRSSQDLRYFTCFRSLSLD